MKRLIGRAAALLGVLALALFAYSTLDVQASHGSAPDPPTNLTITATTTSAITFSWSPPADTTNLNWYRYQRKRTVDSNWGETTAIAASGTSATYFNLQTGVEYDIRVFACLHQSTQCSAELATTAYTSPNKVGGVTKAGRGSVTWSWNKPSGGLTGYEWQTRTSSESDWPNAVDTISDPDATSVTNGEQSQYRFRVRAVAGTSKGAWSDVAMVLGRPATPMNFMVSNVAASSVTLIWDASTTTGGGALTRYLYQWRVDIDGQDPGAGWQSGNTPDGSTLTAEVTDLMPNSDYEFRLRAENAERNGFFTNPPAAATTENISATISSPASLTEGELDGARLTVDLGGTQFVQNLTAGHFGVNPGPAGTSVSNVERQSDTRALLTLRFTGDFSADTSITITVSTFGHTGTGQLATSAIPVTAETAPGTPTITRADGGPGTVTVEWIEVADADGYKVQWKSGMQNYDSSRELVITGGDTTTAVIRNLAPSTNYEVQVAATKRLAPDGTWAATVARTAAISARIDSPSSLHERDLNGAQLTVDIVGTTFVTSLGSGHFSLLPAGVSGLSVASVNRVHTTRAVLTLSYSGNITTNVDLQVVLDGSATAAGSQLTTNAVAVTASEARSHYDSDGDGLIEIYTLAQLNAIRWDPEGRGNTSFFPQHSDAYAAAFPLTSGGSVCPSGTTCSGYELMADLDFDENGDGTITGADAAYWNDGAGWDPIGNSPGYTFDGNGHTISNLFINRSDNSALFASMISPGLFRNVGLVNANVRGRERVGALVGALASGASVTRSYVTGSVTGGASVGGLVGNTLGTVSQSYADVTVTGGVRIGGLVGVLDGSGSVRDSYAAGRVRTNPAAVIGLIPGGQIDGTHVAGLAGVIDGSGSVRTSYSSVIVENTLRPSRTAGLVGWLSANAGRVENSFYDTDNTRDTDTSDADLDRVAVRRSGSTGTLTNVSGRSTAQLQAPTSASGIYAAWGTSVWDFGSSMQYPVLKVDFNNDGRKTWEEFGYQRTATVSGVRANGGTSRVTVSWNAARRADVYRVQWKLSSASSYASGDVIVIGSGSTTQAEIGDLLGDTSYDVRVLATSRAKGFGAPSRTSTARTLPDHAIVSATDPSPLGERNLDGATLTVDLLPGVYDPWAPRLDRASWTATGVPGVTIADVRRVSDERLVVTLASDDTDFDTDRLLRVDIRGAHTSIETVTAVTSVRAEVEPPPGRVQNVRVVPGPLWMRVTWDPVAGATGYRIEWSPAAYASSFHKNWPWPTSYTIGGLQPGTEYRARVVATKERAPDGQASAWASATTPAFSARLVRTEPSELTEDNLNRARLTVDLTGVEWERLVEGRYYRSQLGWLNDCSEAKYYDNCYPFIVDRSVSVAGIERVSGSRAVVTLRARNVDLNGRGLWIRFPDDLHTHYYGEADYIVLQVIAPDEPEDTFETANNQRPEETESTETETEAETTPETPASVIVSESSLSVTEGASATYTVSLSVRPLADVQVHVFATNGVSVQPGVLTFTSANWSAQTVTVGADEDDDTSDGTAWITHSVLAAAGSGYENAPLPGVMTVSIADDDELQAQAAQQQPETEPEPEAQPAQQQQGETEEPEPLELTDRDMLVAFYESTGGAGWTNNANWLSEQPLGRWHGVTTNAEGEVIRLELRINNLSGSLPAALGQLDALEVLSLDRNQLSGSLPVELGNLSNLTRLAMNRNQLSGSIPSELGRLSSLSIIGLARNQLSGSLPESLGGLSGLTRLALHHNAGLSGELPQGLTGSALEYLHFQESGLCAPSDAAFQAWLAGVANKNGPTCAP